MTREKAIKVLKRSQKIISPISPLYEAIGVALKQLDAGATDTDVGNISISRGHENDLISRRAAIYIASGYCHPANIAKELAKLPSAGPKRGKWVEHKSTGYLMCDQCRDVYIDPEWLADGHWKFCPNCGAKMEVTE